MNNANEAVEYQDKPDKVDSIVLVLKHELEGGYADLYQKEYHAESIISHRPQDIFPVFLNRLI